MYSKVQKIWTSGELGAGGETLYKGVGVLNGRGEQLRPCTVGGGLGPCTGTRFPPMNRTTDTTENVTFW